MNRVVIVSAVRTPIGVLGGSLKGYTEQSLAASVMVKAVEAAGVEANTMDEIIVGTAKQTSLPSNCARHAALLAKLPDEVPAYTVQRQSASGMQALANAYWSIGSGNAQLIMAGGTESMTLMPREIHDARYSFNDQTRIIFDPVAAQIEGAQPVEMYGKITADMLAETIGRQYALSKTQLTDFAAASYEKAIAATSSSKAHIVPLAVKKGKATEQFCQDELYDAPQLIADGADAAAMCIVSSAQYAEKTALQPLAEIKAVAVAAGHPAGGLVNIKAVQDVLKKADIAISQIDLVEILEMSSAQVQATCQELKKLGLTDVQLAAKVNTSGGALATGSAWGAAGAILIADLVHCLKERGLTSGLVLVPAEGGQLMAMLIQSL